MRWEDCKRPLTEGRDAPSTACRDSHDDHLLSSHAGAAGEDTPGEADPFVTLHTG
jgi:hypothetical protein